MAVARAPDAGSLSIRPRHPSPSGRAARLYDNRRLTFQPAAWHVVVRRWWQVRRRRRLSRSWPCRAPDPHSAAVAFSSGLPSVFVRKAGRDHGLGRRIEGGDVAGRNVALVEDMVTTGGSSLSAVQALREAGASVTTCLAIISYGFPEADRAFAEAAIGLHVLTTFETVIEASLATGSVTAGVHMAGPGWPTHGAGPRDGYHPGATQMTRAARLGAGAPRRRMTVDSALRGLTVRPMAA
jgi:orotate phosphoribosyltransferase